MRGKVIKSLFCLKMYWKRDVCHSSVPSFVTLKVCKIDAEHFSVLTTLEYLLLNPVHCTTQTCMLYVRVRNWWTQSDIVTFFFFFLSFTPVPLSGARSLCHTAGVSFTSFNLCPCFNGKCGLSSKFRLED